MMGSANLREPGGYKKLYVGNLPMDTSEKLLSDHLKKHVDTECIKSVVVKAGYGFIDCTDQATADTLIDQLHLQPFHGAILTVEPSIPNKSMREPPKRVVFSTQDSNGLTIEEVQNILSKWGGKSFNLLKRPDVSGIHGGGTAYIVSISRDTEHSAEELLSFNGTVTKHGGTMKVKIAGKGSRPGFDEGFRGRRNPSFKISEFPLRIMVPATAVGAIIGKGGATIKEITQTTGAHMNVLKHQAIRPYSGTGNDVLQKVVTISGTPRNCSAACKRVLEILVKDVANKQPNSEADVCLHILAYNSLVGRVIGKAGWNIKQIMEDTQTKIHVSNYAAYQTVFWNGFQEIDRIITIRGSLEGMTSAESQISSKLMSAFEAYQQAKYENIHARGYPVNPVQTAMTSSARYPFPSRPIYSSEYNAYYQPNKLNRMY